MALAGGSGASSSGTGGLSGAVQGGPVQASRGGWLGKGRGVLPKPSLRFPIARPVVVGKDMTSLMTFVGELVQSYNEDDRYALLAALFVLSDVASADGFLSSEEARRLLLQSDREWDAYFIWLCHSCDCDPNRGVSLTAFHRFAYSEGQLIRYIQRSYSELPDSSPLRVPMKPLKESGSEGCRGALVASLFTLLDVASADGSLSSHELFPFAVLRGFTGSRSEFAREFSFIFRTCVGKPIEGLRLGSFRFLVDDESDAGAHCSDEELQDLLKRLLEGLATAAPGASDPTGTFAHGNDQPLCTVPQTCGKSVPPSAILGSRVTRDRDGVGTVVGTYIGSWAGWIMVEWDGHRKDSRGRERGKKPSGYYRMGAEGVWDLTLLDDASSPTPHVIHRWEYLADASANEWWPFPEAAQQEVERAYDAFKAQNPQDGAGTTLMVIGSNTYQLDFAAGTQTNITTKRVRQIRRQMLNASLDDNLASALARAEDLKKELTRLRTTLAAEEARRKAAEFAHADMERQQKAAEDRVAPLSESVATLRKQMEAWRQKDAHKIPPCKVELDADLKAAAQTVLRNTAHGPSYAGGVSACGQMQGATVLRVETNFNAVVWKDYERMKDRIRMRGAHIARVTPTVPLALLHAFPWIAQYLDLDLNERLVFHGTTKDKLPAILKGGFDERFAATGLYGDGVYFAEESCKSAQYCKDVGERCMILARVVLGSPSIATGKRKGERKAPFRDPTDPSQGMHDSVVAHPGIPIGNGQHQQHREFIVFNGMQAYPELVIYFTV
mmetsp:Transcript_125158/g.279213  ORF Transcript_125158/g.279213 Transcript_125158/m.279213 type:complete len:782 (-) Transcript_125158:165-2510(-)